MINKAKLDIPIFFANDHIGYLPSFVNVPTQTRHDLMLKGLLCEGYSHLLSLISWSTFRETNEK